MNKIILFTKQPKTPLMYRGLSSLFYDRISFGEVKDSENDLIDKYKITKFPSLIAYVNIEGDFVLDEPRIDIYNKEINIKDAKAFIENYALPEKYYLKNLDEENKNKKNPNYFFRNLTKSTFQSFGEKNKNRNIILYLSESSEIPKYLHDFAYLTQ